MLYRGSAFVVALLLLASMMVFAGDQKSAQPPKMDAHTRMELIRDLDAEIVYMRRALPMGYKGVVIKNGEVTPSEQQVQDMTALYGPAVKPGDQARITKIDFKGDNKIIFEINGGPKKKEKWYQHIQVGTGTGTTSIPDPNGDTNLNARGSSVTLEFDKYVPEMGPQEVKKLLSPVFNFDAKSAVEAYLDTVPPKVKEAIKDKQVLVGMNREMVTYALGRPPKKYRQDNYEEWIYGEPPKPVQFVRFVGDEVVRLEIMKVDGEKVVRTEKEIDLKQPNVVAQAPAGGNASQPGQDPSAGPGKRPTLMRPGETAADASGSSTATRLPGDTQRRPTDPPLSPGSGPGASTPPGAPPGPPGVPNGIPPQ